jgi:hypothetical protein
MSLRARVGRHTQAGGRQCQNWPDDQQTVIALLNRIPVSDGGAGGSLGGRIVSGLSSDALARALARFEDRHFPGQRSGFVDPGGAMLRRMQELAGRAASGPATAPAPPQAPVETPLDILRRNVLNGAGYRGKKQVWPANDRGLFVALVTMAVSHIDRLKAQGFDKLPWPVELFGRAHVTPHGAMFWPTFTATFKMVFGSGDGHVLHILGPDGLEEAPPLPDMRYGSPVDEKSFVTTEKLPALFLYQDGECFRVPPYHTGLIGLGEADPI